MSDSLTIYKGRSGADGLDGIDGLGPTDVNQRLLDNPIFHCLEPNVFTKISPITWTRNQLAFYTDRYNVKKWSEPESYTNYVDYSEDFSQWNDPVNKWSIIGSISDPLGGNNATEINLDVDTRSAFASPVVERNENGWASGSYVAISFWIKRISGVIDTLDVTTGSTKYEIGTIPDDWERKSIKVSGSSGGFLLGINPRGDSGARIGLFGVQITETILNDYARTLGTNKTVLNNFARIERFNANGYLVENGTTNLIHYSNDLKLWTATSATLEEYQSPDIFGFTYSPIRISYGSIPTVSFSTTTDTLTEGAEYTVSFYAYITGGSLTSITGILGGGAEVQFPQPSTVGFTRISAKLTAGPDNTFELKATSEALTAQLHVQAFQIETGELTSYIDSGISGQSRDADIVDSDYDYNIPAPNLPWSFVFRKSGLVNDANKKFVFSNGETGVNEFSLYFTNRLMTINNGGNTASYDMFDAEKIAVTYDGATIKFYNEQREVYSTALSSTSFLSAKMYIGSDGTQDLFNAYLSKCMFYNVALSLNDIEFLLGA